MSVEDNLAEQIQNLLLSEYQRLLPASLTRIMRTRLPRISRTLIRAALRKLVSEGTLHYTNHFGTTYLEYNYNRYVTVSERILLAPAQLDLAEKQHAVVVKLAAGDAFGSGDHPTTRLALQAVDWVLAEMPPRAGFSNKMALDIGTGSAVLAIAAVKLGIASAWGIDIDPVARYEARANIKLNGLTQRIHISATLADLMTDAKFDLIMANLRVPTLRQFIPLMQPLSRPNAYWILSGFRPDEHAGLIKSMPSKSFRKRWQQDVLDWAAVVLQYCPLPNDKIVATPIFTPEHAGPEK